MISTARQEGSSGNRDWWATIIIIISVSSNFQCAATGGDGKQQQRGQGEAPFGLPMIEELLPDSFLRKAFGRFFQMLQVRGGTQANGWGWPGRQEQRQGSRVHKGKGPQQAAWVCAQCMRSG